MNDNSEVKLHFLDYWRTIKARAGLVVLTFLLVVLTAGVTTYFLPREYYSKVTMEVKQDRNDAIGKVFTSSGGTGNDPTFLPTQFQILMKKELLYPVMDELKLVEKWSGEGAIRQMPREAAYAKLVKMLDIKEVRATGLIEIGVYSTDPQEAANIANTLAVVYKNERLTNLQESRDRALRQLREEVEKQRQKVADAAVEVARIRERDQITDPDPENMNAVISSSDRNIVAIETQLNEQRLKLTKLEGTFEQIMKMKPEELREVLRTLQIPDENVGKMVDSLHLAASKEVELFAAGLGENHPRLQAEREKKKLYHAELSNYLDSVRRNQAFLLDSERRTLKELETRFDDVKASNIQDKQKQVAYVDAKTRYLQAKRIAESADTKYNTELLESGIDFEPTQIWEKAEPSIGWARPNVPAYITLAAVMGLMLGVGLAFFIEYLDTSVKTIDDVEKHLQVPVLAVVPKDVSALIKSTGETPEAEAYRILRANVEFNKPNRNSNTFTLVSGGPGEGKSTTLNNLAYTCAQGGYHVLVVDADLRRPTQHRFYECDNEVGLVDYLQGRADLDEIVKPTKLDNLSFIASGRLPGDAVGILNSQRMVDAIDRLKKQYDLVFFDSPPILGVSDGSVLASECDATIMVVQHRRFPRAMLLRVKQAVMQSGGKLIGVVLNNVDNKHDDSGYYNYSDYYQRPAQENKVKAAPRRQAKPSVPEPKPAATGAPSAGTSLAKTETRTPAVRDDHDDY